MKKILFFMLLSVISYDVSAQGPSKKCPTCGQSMAKCQYKGKHPNKTAQRPAKPSTQKSVDQKQVTISNGVLFNNHYYVDLGLPSGTKWATTNVGANSPSDYGNHYAWGETSPKSTYNWNNLKHRISGGDGDAKFSKYVINNKQGNIDGKNELDLEDDAAYINWGYCWRIPSETQFAELHKNCKWIWMTIDGHHGYKVTGKNGNSIFLPAAGYGYGSEGIVSIGSFALYWSRTLSSYADAIEFTFSSEKNNLNLNGWSYRRCGGSIRPVFIP